MRLVSLVASFKIKCSSFGLFERGFLFYLNIVYEIAKQEREIEMKAKRILKVTRIN